MNCTMMDGSTIVKPAATLSWCTDKPGMIKMLRDYMCLGWLSCSARVRVTRNPQTARSLACNFRTALPLGELVCSTVPVLSHSSLGMCWIAFTFSEAHNSGHDSSAVGRGRAGYHRPDHDQQHCYHHAPTVKPEAVTAVVELLVMGVRTPETC